MSFPVNSFILESMRVRHGHNRFMHMTREGAIAIIILLTVCGIISYFYIRIKKNQMMQTTGCDSSKDFRDLKQSCPVNYKNLFCMSEEWVVNERTFKVYPTDSVTDVSRLSGGSSGSNTITRCGILIRYKGGTDKFIANRSDERDKLLSEIEDYLKQIRN